jgi:hypothetical protein
MPRTLPLALAYRARSSKRLAARIASRRVETADVFDLGYGVVTQKPALLRKRNPKRDATDQV